MQAAKKYIKGILIICGLLIGYMGYKWYQTDSTQTFVMEAITEHAGNKTDITDICHLQIKEKIVPGKAYDISVRYEIVPKRGNGLFRKRVEEDKYKKANIGCSEMIMTGKVNAKKERLILKIGLTINPSDITDGNGHTFQPDKEMLHPVYEIKESGEKL